MLVDPHAVLFSSSFDHPSPSMSESIWSQTMSPSMSLGVTLASRAFPPQMPLSTSLSHPSPSMSSSCVSQIMSRSMSAGLSEARLGLDPHRISSRSSHPSPSSSVSSMRGGVLVDEPMSSSGMPSPSVSLFAAGSSGNASRKSRIPSLSLSSSSASQKPFSLASGGRLLGSVGSLPQRSSRSSVSPSPSVSESRKSQMPSPSMSDGRLSKSTGSVLQMASISSFQPSRSLSPSVSTMTEIMRVAVSVLVPEMTWIVYGVMGIVDSGVPQMVPFSSPNESPSGRLGEMSHSWTGAPTVWPAKGCISLPCTSCMEGVGKVTPMPSLTTESVTSTVFEPPVLTAVTVTVVGAVMRYGFPNIAPVMGLNERSNGRSPSNCQEDESPPVMVGSTSA